MMPASKKYTVNDLQAHGEKGNLWILLHGKVHDVSKFYLEHPYVTHTHERHTRGLARG